ncbi:hypothetical protein FIM04_04050 [SAR202 cluster bacterium AC-409-J13_OGT_754m]|nr:hypothetical protein [SAR202 cluster bacterium AC-409-J13_OGT_754m]
MKKILSIFLLSAMLVLVLGGCESEEPKGGVTNTQARLDVDARVAEMNEQEEAERIDRLERRVLSLTYEVIMLHACARQSRDHRTSTSGNLYSHGGCGGAYMKRDSPYSSDEAYDAWEAKDYRGAPSQ